MRLYMIRHGESTANAERKHAGWSQIPLTDAGREDAVRAGTLIEGICFDRVYVSDLLRARQTQELALPGADVISTHLLREIGVGELAGYTATECLARYGEIYQTKKAVHDFVPFGGEDHGMHLCRIREFSHLLACDPADTVAAFCHEGSIRCMLEIALGRECPPREYRLDNGSVSVFEYADGAWSCIDWNKTDRVIK